MLNNIFHSRAICIFFILHIPSCYNEEAEIYIIEDDDFDLAEYNFTGHGQ